MMKVVAGALMLLALGVPARGTWRAHRSLVPWFHRSSLTLERSFSHAPGAAVQSQATCNFGELMRRLQDTVEGRMTVEDLRADHVVEDCELGLRPAYRLILLCGPSWS